MGVKSSVGFPFENHDNRGQHTVRIPKDIIVPESDDPEPSRLQPTGALRIVVRLLLVLPAVKLDNQSPFIADKIRDVLADCLLTPKLEAEQLVSAQMAP